MPLLSEQPLNKIIERCVCIQQWRDTNECGNDWKAKPCLPYPWTPRSTVSEQPISFKLPNHYYGNNNLLCSVNGQWFFIQLFLHYDLMKMMNQNVVYCHKRFKTISWPIELKPWDNCRQKCKLLLQVTANCTTLLVLLYISSAVVNVCM